MPIPMTVKGIILTMVVGVLNLAAFAQDTVQVSLKFLVDNKQYDKVIHDYASTSEGYSAQSLYYIGMAYFYKGNDSSCLQFIGLSIQKDSTIADAWDIKGTTLNYGGRFQEALTCFQTAISLNPKDVNAYSGTGDAWYALKQYDQALDAYQHAIAMDGCADRIYTLIGQIYNDKHDNEKALAAYNTALSKISRQSDSYLYALYNIGLMEYLNGNDDKAEHAFLELLEINPNDYQVYAKLIQVYYHQEKFDKAKPWRDKLYKAKEDNLLKGTLADRFCFEQFKWNDYRVIVYERYQTKSEGNIFYKHIFFVVDEKETVVMTVQTEYSSASLAFGGSKYLLCASKGSTHLNPGIGFDDDMKYKDLKKAAIKLMDRYLK